MIPNIRDLELDSQDTENEDVLEKREKYAQAILLLFYPYRIEDDLKSEGTYWKQYTRALKDEQFSKLCLQVMQNIQDVTYNCSNFKQAGDILETKTDYIPHEDDDKVTKDENEESIPIKQYEEILKNLMTNSDHGIRHVDPKVRSLNVIAKRFDIVEQEIAQNISSMQNLDDITTIPDFLMNSKSYLR